MSRKMHLPRSIQSRKSQLAASALVFLLAMSAVIPPAQSQGHPATGDARFIEQIVLFRHGEKPQPEGFGQLSCKGLNRALSLPSALERYGTPTHLFAPDPAIPYYPDVSTPDMTATGRFSYVRPLVTLDTLAIILPSLSKHAPLPVDVKYAYYQADNLATTLLQPDIFRSNIFIAWEHVNITTIARDIMQRFVNTSGKVPDVWADDDYDSVYVITIDRTPGKTVTARFEQSCEGLGDGGRACPLPAGHRELSSICPGPAMTTQAIQHH